MRAVLNPEGQRAAVGVEKPGQADLAARNARRALHAGEVRVSIRIDAHSDARRRGSDGELRSAERARALDDQVPGRFRFALLGQCAANRLGINVHAAGEVFDGNRRVGGEDLRRVGKGHP